MQFLQKTATTLNSSCSFGLQLQQGGAVSVSVTVSRVLVVVSSVIIYVSVVVTVAISGAGT